MQPCICKCQAIWGSEQGPREGLLNVLVKHDLVEDTTVVGGDADAAAVRASLHDTRTVCGGECPSPYHAAWEPVARSSQEQDPADCSLVAELELPLESALGHHCLSCPGLPLFWASCRKE